MKSIDSQNLSSGKQGKRIKLLYSGQHIFWENISSFKRKAYQLINQQAFYKKSGYGLLKSYSLKPTLSAA